MDSEKKYERYKEEFDLMSSNVEETVLIADKKLDRVMIDQLGLQLKWEKLYAKVYALLDIAQAETEKEFGRAYTEATSDAYKTVSATDAKHIALYDDQYMDAKRFENKVFRLKKEVEAVVGVIESRKYILKDLTASIINGCNTHII